MVRVALKPSARRDLKEILDYLEHASGSPSIRRRFLLSFEQTCRLLAQYPDSGRVETAACAEEQTDPEGRRATELRRMVMQRFPKYLIFYLPRKNTMEIVRVLHGARNTGSQNDAASE